MAYRDFKVLAKRAALDKVLRDKAFNIARNPKQDIKGVLTQWFTNFLIKSQQVVVLKMKLNKMINQLKNYTNQLL